MGSPDELISHRPSVKPNTDSAVRRRNVLSVTSISDSERVRRITQQAAEIAAVVPENLQEAAFNRAFEQLLAAGEPGQADSAGQKRPQSSAARRRSSSTPSDERLDGEDPVAHLMSNLSRTDHPEIGRAPKALDRALHLLRIAERDHGIDGLSAPQLARLLTDKFRLRVTRQALSQALDGAGEYVDRVPTGKVTVYRLMEPGERYLDAGGAAAEQADEPKTTPRRRTTRRGGTNAAATAPKSPEAASAKATARRRSSRGPKTLVEELIGDGYFGQPRTIGDIQDRLRHKKGTTLRASDLSPTLVRLLRERKLDRERNEGGQYEYRVPS